LSVVSCQFPVKRNSVVAFTFTGNLSKKEDTGLSTRCLPEGRKCAVAQMFQIA
jgi:hypothetical protein